MQANFDKVDKQTGLVGKEQVLNPKRKIDLLVVDLIGRLITKCKKNEKRTAQQNLLTPYRAKAKVVTKIQLEWTLGIPKQTGEVAHDKKMCATVIARQKNYVRKMQSRGSQEPSIKNGNWASALLKYSMKAKKLTAKYGANLIDLLTILKFN